MGEAGVNAFWGFDDLPRAWIDKILFFKHKFRANAFAFGLPTGQLTHGTATAVAVGRVDFLPNGVVNGANEVVVRLVGVTFILRTTSDVF